MALLISRTSLGGTDARVAADLAAAIDRVNLSVTRHIDDSVLSVPDYRSWFEEYAELIVPATARPAVTTRDRMAGHAAAAVRVRTYEPEAARAALVFAHGGAWLMGSVETHDHICRWLAVSCGIRVISVDYGLAPERPAPYAIDQVAGVITQVLTETGLPVFAAGDSAGAQITSLALLRLEPAQRAQIAGFISIYGAYSPRMNLSSHQLFGDGRFGLSKKQMAWAWNLYAPHLSPDERDSLTPLGLSLDDFPPTLCIGAECDPLLDDTLALYSSLARAGRDVTLSLWAGINHGALHFVGQVQSVTSAAQTIVQYIRSRLPGSFESMGGSRNIDAIAVDEYVQLPMLLGNMRGHHRIDTPHLTSRTRRHGTLAHRIGRDIVAGKYEAGSLLDPEVGEGADNAVSRGSYREALRTLAAKGLITAAPRSGTRVAPRSSWRLLDPDVLAWFFEGGLDEHVLREAFEFRKVVEPSAAALTATRSSALLRASLAEAVLKITEGSPDDQSWRDAIVRFHELVLQGSENEILAATWPAIQVVVSWSVTLAMAAGRRGLARDRAGDYASLLDKITLRDASGAMIAMARLIDGAMGDVMTLLDQRSVEEASAPMEPTGEQ